ncbi:hypothetical protein O181_014670 [Austropuccinia psidii MF-1]|uniref:GAF domain-containing protein n=1 Tax=Austropuccinia psidii MF-1 TaxID=1389203 RepID=A0A9Q3GQ53_9BASI|nr:hypothetical protein [Austropuccinia psidii MF-1]
MPNIIGFPVGDMLPYSFFDFNSSQLTKKCVSRPSEYFYEKATANSLDGPINRQLQQTANVSWLEDEIPAFSDSEDDRPAQIVTKRPSFLKKEKRVIRLRHIAFKAFTSKEKFNPNATIQSMEIISKFTSINPSDPPRSTIFKSWKIKSRARKAQINKMQAIVKTRISQSSPIDQHPKTWGQYHKLYANQCIDIISPPLPPTEPTPQGSPPTPYQSKCYFPPKAANEKTRQLILDRLGVFGRSHFDPTEQGIEKAKNRIAWGDKLMREGHSPADLTTFWEPHNTVFDTKSSNNLSPLPYRQKRLGDLNQHNIPPETLEQHPVFRMIVEDCRKMLGTSLSILTAMDDDRGVVLAEAGLDGLREAIRQESICSHTMLCGRKGFAILDIQQDWRFQNGPLVHNFGLRFYAGVPVMAPNFDGSIESEENLYPLGTLCVADSKPRKSFGIAERKRLVYMAEFVRREIEKWYKKKMDLKLNELEKSYSQWSNILKRAKSAENNKSHITSKIRLYQQFSRSLSLPFSSATKNDSVVPRSITSTNSSVTSLPSPFFVKDFPTPLSYTSLFEDARAAVNPKMQNIFDLATKIIGETLELSFVYLTAIAPVDESQQIGQMAFISGHNIPLPIPRFDYGLHLNVLRRPEGGMLYQNQSIEESTPISETERSIKNNFILPKPSSHASALLTSVSQEEKTGGGFVLGAFTSDPKRVFGAEDVVYMKRFAQELSKYTRQLKL